MTEYINLRIRNCILELETAVLIAEPILYARLMGNGDRGKKVITAVEAEEKPSDESEEMFSKDLLQSFLGSASQREPVKEVEEIELNLGLSLGGDFGAEKRSKNLTRSSSTASYVPLARGDTAAAEAEAEDGGLERTSSLPAEIAEEMRKRKELLELRRMEAKKRRSEKQKGSMGDKEIEVNLTREVDRQRHLAAMKKLDSALGGAFFDTSSNPGGGIDVMGRGKGIFPGGMQGFGQVVSQGSSAESTAGSSLSFSDLESKALRGSSGELSHAGSTLSLQERSHLEDSSSIAKTRAITSTASGSEMQRDASRTRGRERRTNPLLDMPSVYTRGDGPNGRRVDGILYRYGGGEEVRIMCICHGHFHSPAEFVLHAGGTDVANPLRHIVIDPNPDPFL